MPKFYEMVEVEAEVWVDPQAFLSECSEKEIKSIIKCLVEDGHLNSTNIKKTNDNFLDEMWSEKIEKILCNRLLLSDEEIEFIEKIANRL